MNRLESPHRTPLHDGVLERLRQMIIRGQLKPGGRISEIEFGQAFGVSRTPLREALKLLAAEGLVEIRPHKGAVIADISLDEISEIFALMNSLELMAGPLVCERISNIDLQMLEDLVKDMDDCQDKGDLEGYFDLNTAFHNGIVALSGNRVLTQVYADMFGKLQRARHEVNYDQRRWKESSVEHHWIMEALRVRNGKEFGHRLKVHNEHTATAVIAGLKTSVSSRGRSHAGPASGVERAARAAVR
jgi:DNA-binding GntR family transcriptional regulator